MAKTNISFGNIIIFFFNIVTTGALAVWVIIFAEIKVPKEDYFFNAFALIFGALALILTTFAIFIGVLAVFGVSTIRSWVTEITDKELKRRNQEDLEKSNQKSRESFKPKKEETNKFKNPKEYETE